MALDLPPVAARFNGACALTVLRCLPPLVATKRIRATADGLEVVQSGEAKRWAWSIEPVGGLDDIEAVLMRLSGDARACIIGEGVRDGAGDIIRRAFDGDIVRRDRRWLAFDCDGWTPPGWPLGREPDDDDIRAAVAALRDTLPGLEGAACVYRLSATSGLWKDDEGRLRRGWAGLRCHLWFWLPRPVAPASVKPWLKRVLEVGGDGFPSWDAGMLDGARVHYVAAPVFEGVRDFAAGLARVGRLPGLPVVAPADWVTGAVLEAREAEAREAARVRLEMLASVRLSGSGFGDDVARILASRVRANVEEAGSASSKESGTAFKAARKALTCAHALEAAGEGGAVQWCEGLLSGVVSARTVANALKGISPDAVADSLEGARRARKPATAPRWVPPIEPAGRDARFNGAANEDAFPVEALDEVEAELPGDVAGVHAGILGRLSRDWPAELVRSVGFELLEEAATMGGGVIGDDEGDAVRVFLRRLASSKRGRGLLRRAGLVTPSGAAWGPLARGAGPVLLLPVRAPEGGIPCGWATLSGDACGERWPVGLRWTADEVMDAPPSKRPAVIVADVLDAVALGPLSYGLPGEELRDALDVVAIGDTWPASWGRILEGRSAVLVAVSGVHPAAGDIRSAATAAGVPVAMAGRVPGSASWREAAVQYGARRIVERWRAKVREVVR